MPRRLSLKYVNRLLLVLILIINLWVIFMPLRPVISWWWQNHIGHKSQRLNTKIVQVQRSNKGFLVPNGEHLIIPSIGLDQAITEARSIRFINNGVWRWPASVPPTKTGNTVLIGHRFTYHYGIPAFFHLDLVKKGDVVALWWNGRQYTYHVTDIKVVKPSDTSIIQPTSDSQLTMYTCTPLWTNKYRLVIIAKGDTP